MKKAETKTSADAKVTAPREKTVAVKKTAAKKPAAKKEEKTVIAKTAQEPKIILQFGEISLDHETLVGNVRNYLQYDRHIAPKDQVGVEIYLKPEEMRAYIVANGKEEGYMNL